MSLTKLKRISYLKDRTGRSSSTLAIDFTVIGQEVFIILMENERIQCLNIDPKTGRQIRLSMPEYENYRVHPIALQRISRNKLAVFFRSNSQLHSPLKRLIAFYTREGQRLDNVVELEWKGWDPAGRAFLVTQEGNYVFPHDRIPPRNLADYERQLQSDKPLLDLYNAEGQKLFSFGIGQFHADINMAAVLNRGYLASHSNDDLFFAFEYPYRLLKFNNEGSLVWDKVVELPFPVNPPVMEESMRSEHGVNVSCIFSRVVKDISVGATWISLLVSGGPFEVSTRFSSRIDRYTFDGELIDSSHLDEPASLIQMDEDNLWILNESIGNLTQYRFM
jgi:hypothetical protein